MKPSQLRISPTLVDRLRAVGVVEREDRGLGERRRWRPGSPGWSGLPSTLVGRPMWLSTSTPAAEAADRDGRGEEQRPPGDRSPPAACTYGTIFSVGCRCRRSARPAPARHPSASGTAGGRRRPPKTLACRGNSLCRNHSNSSVSASSSRPRQYAGPWCWPAERGWRPDRWAASRRTGPSRVLDPCLLLASPCLSQLIDGTSSSWSAAGAGCRTPSPACARAPADRRSAASTSC